MTIHGQTSNYLMNEISILKVGSAMWNIVYQTTDNQTEFETVTALDHEEAYHAAVKIITKQLA